MKLRVQLCRPSWSPVFVEFVGVERASTKIADKDRRGRLPTKTADKVRAHSGFTLAEVLAALMFMAIVIPVAMQGLKIANQSGEVAVRKAEATRVAERVLTESIITTNWNRSTPSGIAMEGTHQFRYQLRNGPWLQEPMRALSVQVGFQVQGQDYNVLLSTLVDNSPPQ